MPVARVAAPGVCKTLHEPLLSKERLGRHRWVIERTFASLARNRLTIRYERLAALQQAFLHLGCTLMCLNRLQGLERRC